MFDRANNEELTSLDIMARSTENLRTVAVSINRYFGYGIASRRKDIKPIKRNDVIAAVDSFLNNRKGKNYALSSDIHSRYEQCSGSTFISGSSWLLRGRDHAIFFHFDSDNEVYLYAPDDEKAKFWFESILEAIEHLLLPEAPDGLIIREVHDIDRTSNGPSINSKEIQLSTVLRPHVDLYPHFKAIEGFDMDLFVEEYLLSRESVILNYGPPGTGKTTFATGVARLALEMEGEGWKIYIYRNSTVMEDISLLNEVVGKANDKTLFIFEDLDKLLRPRSGIKGNAFMSTLLNASAGMDDRNIKFIFNTNQLDLSLIDEALYRPGRCFAKIYSGLLGQNDINPARVAAGKDEVDTSAFAGKRISLAQALSINPRNETGLREFGTVEQDLPFITNSMAAESRYGVKPDLEVETIDDLPVPAMKNTTALITTTKEMYQYKKSSGWRPMKAN